MMLPENEEEEKTLCGFLYTKWQNKKKFFEDFTNINSSGKIAMKLDENDKIIGVEKCKEDQDIILGTKFGKCIRFISKN